MFTGGRVQREAKRKLVAQPEISHEAAEAILSVDRYTSHVIFLIHLAHVITLIIVAQGVFGAHSFHPHAIHDVTCLSVRCWSSFCFLSLYLSLLPLLFHCLPVLCPAQLPQCRHRRGLKPLHSRTIEILPHNDTQSSHR